MDNSVKVERLASQPQFEEAPDENSEESEEDAPKTLAQIFKENSFTAKRLACEHAAQQWQEVKVAISRQKR